MVFFHYWQYTIMFIVYGSKTIRHIFRPSYGFKPLIVRFERMDIINAQLHQVFVIYVFVYDLLLFSLDHRNIVILLLFQVLSQRSSSYIIESSSSNSNIQEFYSRSEHSMGKTDKKWARVCAPWEWITHYLDWKEPCEERF